MKTLVAFAFVLAFGINTLAQVTVKGVDAAKVKEYGSPMTIDLPLAGLFATPEGKVWVAEDLSGYVCKGVFVKKLALKWKLKEGGGIAVSGDIELANAGEDDVKTTARYSLVMDGKPIATDTDENIDTEEGSTRFRRLKLTVRGTPDGEKKDAVLSIVLAVTKG